MIGETNQLEEDQDELALDEAQEDGDRFVDDEESPEALALNMGKRAVKRINKLVYERNIEREQNQKLIAGQEALRKELEELKAKQTEAFSRQSQQDTDSRKQALTAQKREALELGEYDRVIEIDNELMDIVVKANSAQQRKEPIEEPKAQDSEPKRYVPKAQQEWLEKNPWLSDEKQKPRFDKANSIYIRLVEQGFDPEDSETYQEIDRIMRAQAPKVAGGGIDRGENYGSPASKGLSSEDKAKMRQWGLDPEKPADRLSWLESKKRTGAQDGR